MHPIIPSTYLSKPIIDQNANESTQAFIIFLMKFVLTMFCSWIVVKIVFLCFLSLSFCLFVDA
jgi:hypothetical protein